MIWTRDGRAKDPRLCTTSPHLGVRQGRKKDYGRIKMHIASHNVRTLSTDSLLDVYLQQLEKIKADIIGVCETRRARAVSARWTSGEEILLGEGANNVPRTGGVGFIIKAKMVPYIISCDIISPRVAVLKVKLQKLGNRTLKMVQVYAPTISAEDDEIERFYEEIEMALKLKSTYTIVQGDFNAVVGSRLDETEYLIGRYGAGVRNDRGNRLIEFAEQHRFSIMNTFFEKKTKRLWTWRSSDTRTLRQIDYVLTDTPRLFADSKGGAFPEVTLITDDPDVREINLGLSPGFTFDTRCYTYAVNVTFVNDANEFVKSKERCYCETNFLIND
ncbi:endonuclease/exonuclease/phosphatase family protein [Ostertagia ostertagi]